MTHVEVAEWAAVRGLAEVADHQPDVDLRQPGITVRLMTHDAEMGLSDRDVALARHISEAARSLGVTADPTALQDVNIAIDAHVHSDVIRFWSAVLGYQQVGEEDLIDPQMRWSGIWFQQMHVPRTERNRIHVDVFVPVEQARARVAAAVAAGGRVVNDANPRCGGPSPTPRATKSTSPPCRDAANQSSPCTPCRGVAPRPIAVLSQVADEQPRPARKSNDQRAAASPRTRIPPTPALQEAPIPVGADR